MHRGPYLATIFCCLVAALVTAPVHAGILLILVVPMVCVWALANAYRAWRHPETWRLRAACVGIWAANLAAILAIHWHYKDAARHAGQVAVTAITRYKAAHNSYPPSLKATGLVGDPRWRITYGVGKDGPVLFYPSTFVPFDTYWYNFDRGIWEYQPD